MKRAVIRGCVIVGAILAAAALFRCFRELRQLPDAPPSVLRGGRGAASALAPRAPGKPLEFIVAGDCHSTGTAEKLYGLAAGDDIDFVVLAGDFARRPSYECHRFFWREIEESGIDVPVFLVAGDDDFLTEGPRSETPLGRRQYEEWYGPLNYSFYAGGCLFIVLYNVPESGDDSYLDFLEETLENRRAGTRRTFVFTHVPPYFSLPAAPPEILEDSPRFFALLEKYGVDYCFSGHEHGYWRGERNGVRYVKVAGGGGRLPSREGWGMFHHAMKLRVEDGLVAEDLVVLPARRPPRDLACYVCSVHVAPCLLHHPCAFGLAAALLASLLFILIARAGRRRIKRTARGRGAGRNGPGPPR